MEMPFFNLLKMVLCTCNDLRDGAIEKVKAVANQPDYEVSTPSVYNKVKAALLQ